MPRILQLTDLHLLPLQTDRMLGIDTGFYFQEVVASAFAKYRHFDLIIVTGDLAQHPCLSTYKRVAEHLRIYDTPAILLPGNHDDLELMQSALAQMQISHSRHLALGNWQIIGMNSQIPGKSAGRLSKQELNFLTEILKRHSTVATLIAMHHHCISSNSPWMDSMQIENSEEFLALIASHPQVKAVCFGHIHQEMAKQQSGQWFYACPSTCFQFRPNAQEFAIDPLPPGYRVFELDDDGSMHSTCHRLASIPAGLQSQSHGY